MNAPTLSVIMPNYNHGHYIAEALQAIIEQSFQPKEVIVVDDASTDNSVEIISRFVKRYPFVKLIQNSRNFGADQSANAALSQATGDYFICTSADDKILSGLFEKSMNLLARYPQAGLCSALVNLLSPEGKYLGLCWTPIISKTASYFPAEEVRKLWQRIGSWITTHSVILRRDAALEFGGYAGEMGSTADGFLVTLTALKYGVCFIPEPLASWRRVPTGFSMSQGRSGAAMEAWQRLHQQFTSVKYKYLFPDDFIAAWSRQCLLASIYEFNAMGGDARNQIAQALSLLPTHRLTDRIAEKTLGLPPKLRALAIKLYLFINQPPSNQLYLVVRKLKTSLGISA